MPVYYNHFHDGDPVKRIFLVIAGLLFTACSSVTSLDAKSLDKLAEIQARGTLVIATDADYAPQSQLL